MLPSIFRAPTFRLDKIQLVSYVVQREGFYMERTSIQGLKKSTKSNFCAVSSDKGKLTEGGTPKRIHKR